MNGERPNANTSAPSSSGPGTPRRTTGTPSSSAARPGSPRRALRRSKRSSSIPPPASSTTCSAWCSCKAVTIRARSTHSGRRAEALAELGRATESGVKHAALRAWVLAEMGDLTAATRLLRDLEGRSHREYVDLGMLAALHAQTGDKDRAFALLDKAYAERDWSLRDLKVSPVWDPLRSDPRFSRLLKRVNLD